MNTFIKIFHQVKYSAFATIITVALWMVLADIAFLKPYLELFVYATFGWMFLGGVCIPWVERKLEEIFS